MLLVIALLFSLKRILVLANMFGGLIPRRPPVVVVAVVVLLRGETCCSGVSERQEPPGEGAKSPRLS